jgi:hypothetical protein
MSQLSKKISELEKKRRRKSTAQYLTVALIVLGAFAFYYIVTFDNQVKSEQTIEANIKIIEEKKGKLIAEEKKTIEEKGNIQEIYSTNRYYLEEIQKALDEIKASESSRKKRTKIDDLIAKVNNLHRFNSDEVTIVFESVEMNMIPYVEPEDSIQDFASKVLQNIKTPSGPSMNTVPKKPNTLYYGSLITTSYIDSLSKDLMSKGIEIEYFAPFKNDENSYQNEKSIQLLYVDYNNIVAKNDDYHIRLYSYNPNPANKKIIENTLTNQKYNFQVFPDWVKKPTFFSDVPTVLYYDDNVKKEAEELAKILSNDLPDGIDFVARKGEGYGISDKEKRALLIIQYLATP